jgi:hypothetical protein
MRNNTSAAPPSFLFLTFLKSDFNYFGFRFLTIYDSSLTKMFITITVKKPRVINAFLSFRNAFLNQKREREHFEAFQTVL